MIFTLHINSHCLNVNPSHDAIRAVFLITKSVRSILLQKTAYVRKTEPFGVVFLAVQNVTLEDES